MQFFTTVYLCTNEKDQDIRPDTSFAIYEWPKKTLERPINMFLDRKKLDVISFVDYILPQAIFDF